MEEGVAPEGPRGVAPGRTKGALGGAWEDQRRLGRRPGGLMSRGAVPRRIKGALGGAQ